MSCKTRDDINSLIDGSGLPLVSASQKGVLPATGTPSGKFFKDDGTWATGGGGTAVETHIPMINLAVAQTF